jgi:hypothetical protein
LPMPLAAPVITATFPSCSFGMAVQFTRASRPRCRGLLAISLCATTAARGRASASRHPMESIRIATCGHPACAAHPSGPESW